MAMVSWGLEKENAAIKQWRRVMKLQLFLRD
jgi:hypothetical protein